MLKYGLILTVVGVLLAIYFRDINLAIKPIVNESRKQVVFTLNELSSYNGVQKPFLYLAILGNIFNVTKGHKHYGPGEQYHFFIGRDASRNFVTGEFNEKDASDDVSSLSPQELRSLSNWLKFYKKEYQKVGVLAGRFYNEFGELTPFARQVKKLIYDSHNVEKMKQLEKEQFPPCNIAWSAETGSRVWCTAQSGGVKRSWIGKPRQYYEPGSKSYRCACINEENKNIGIIKEYPECNSNARSCYVDLS